MEDYETTALGRLRRFLRTDLQREDVPSAFRSEYESWLTRIGGSAPPNPGTPLDELAISQRARGYLRRSRF